MFISVEKFNELIRLREEVAQLTLSKKIDEQEVHHLIKMREGQLQIEKDKAVAGAIKEKQEELMAMKESHATEMAELLRGINEDTKTMYSQILLRLPNIEVAMKKDL